jgi:hypothetical protein
MKLLVWRSCALVMAVSVHLSASMLFTTPGSGGPRPGEGFSLGTQFKVNSPDILVTALGIYDTGGQFGDNHEVALWDDSANGSLNGPMTADVTVLKTSTNPATPAGFIFVLLATPVKLVKNDIYTLAAYYAGAVGPPPTGDSLLDPGGAATDPNFSNFAGRFNNAGYPAGHLTEPDTNFGAPSYIGPNLQFQTPEPATLMTVGAALLALAFARKRFVQ